MAGTDEPEGFGDNAEDMGSETEERYGSDAGEDLPEDDTGESGLGEETGDAEEGEEYQEYQDRDEDVAEPYDDAERDGGLSGGLDPGEDDESSGR